MLIVLGNVLPTLESYIRDFVFFVVQYVRDKNTKGTSECRKYDLLRTRRRKP